MGRIIYIIGILLLLPLLSYAQRVKQVCGEYTYYAEGNESPNQAKLKAWEGAKVEALAREFGTIVSQSTTQSETLANGEENTYFSQLSSTEVKGEWLEDVGEPEYEVEFVDDMLVVKCRACGKARELSNVAVDFEAVVLRNGTEKKFADVGFRGGDDMYLLFRSPVDGYVAAYLVDETPVAYCLLPYIDDADGQQPVEHGREYIFFSEAKAEEESGKVDEYTLTCGSDIERNRLYVIFSPEPFTKALDTQVSDALPRQLSYEDFSKWLGTCRKRDKKMGVKVMYIEIKK